jgi:hypothetical protein
MTPLPCTPILGPMAMSDLFFNHDLSAWDELYAKENKDPPSPEQQEAAIKECAESFVDCLDAGKDRAALVAWLVEDFFRRL